MANRPTSRRVVVALAIGDPGGVGPELTARLVAADEVRAAVDLVLFGDRRILDAGARTAGVRLDLGVVASDEAAASDGGKPVLVDLAHVDPAEIVPGAASRAGGRSATENFRRALRFAASGHADAVCYTPLNKQAMRMASPGYDDDARFVRDVLGGSGPVSEFNVLEGLWNARVTSHVPLSAVAAAVTREAVLRSLALTDGSMRAAGFARPRIAVAALNPHAGDGGSFGREEIEVIEPAVRDAAARGIAAEGPFPADTVFLRARDGTFDAVLTMYHDQGQIAMKLMGFERGVTYLGGFPFPVCTPAHGTAYDIAGRGTANPGASRAAVLLAAAMAASEPATSLKVPIGDAADGPARDQAVTSGCPRARRAAG